MSAFRSRETNQGFVLACEKCITLSLVLSFSSSSMYWLAHTIYTSRRRIGKILYHTSCYTINNINCSGIAKHLTHIIHVILLQLLNITTENQVIVMPNLSSFVALWLSWDNHQCHQWRQSWHHDNCWSSVIYWNYVLLSQLPRLPQRRPRRHRPRP